MSWEMPTSISPSRMASFLQCPMQFRFESIQKLGGGTNAAAVAGTTMHAALEQLMALPGPERTTERLAGFIEEALVDVRLTEDYLSLTKDQLKDFDAKCRRVAPRAFDMLPLADVNAEAVELWMEVDVGGWMLRGYVDLLENRIDFGRIVWDYKTGRTPMVQYQDKALLGLELYAVMCRYHFGEIPAGVGLLYLESRTAIKRVPTEATVDATERKLAAVKRAMERACAEDAFKPKTSKLCDYCAFRQWCPAFGGDPSRAADDIAQATALIS